MRKHVLIWAILVLILISLIFTPISFNANGLTNAKEMIQAAFTPSLKQLPGAFEAAIITLSYAFSAIGIALIFSFILSLYASELLKSNRTIRKIIHGIFSGSRAVHELIWALFLVTIFGLKPMPGILALAIPYTGMLGKVFTDIFRQLDTQSIVRLKQAGASKGQLILYGYIPQALPQLMSYTFYRLECAFRSSAVLGFVGISGIGLKIQLMLNDLRFNDMFTYIYVLIFFVILIEAWTAQYRRRTHEKTSLAIFFSMIVISFFYIGFGQGAIYDDMLTSKNLGFAFQLIKDLLGFTNQNPAFTDILEIQQVLFLTLKTIQMSFVAISIATTAMLLTLVLGTKRFSHPIAYGLTRLVYIITRAVPELIWAMILVFIFKPGIWVGALALGLHNYGIISKLCADVIESLPDEPLQHLRFTGASRPQLLIYGVIPSVIKRFVSYIIYRWEIILRTTIVVGIAGAGGLGYYFKFHFSLFHYTHITLVIIVFMLLVKLADTTSNKLLKFVQ
ncbi:ABC transporter permease subunit [Acidaminobacter sp. JC074]|uniref:PhnE/PtxC family ABC transporter permease n=1 Tax=Acidaminobacter sp. JC074 TaxID=2530199 RepID=UPI001F0E8F0F|nr:ABC transporter permease subunit [Acidaminobacter sp. JC074]MCH4888690.1 ABC transporter permease subunit [Acidaminobacter sp. JC074]